MTLVSTPLSAEDCPQLKGENIFLTLHIENEADPTYQVWRSVEDERLLMRLKCSESLYIPF